MKIVIIGGHLSPALCVIDELPKTANLLYIGRKNALEGDKNNSLEFETITGLGIPFENLVTGRLQRTFTKYTIPSLFKTPYGLVRAIVILRKFKPDAVIGFGGYLSFPAVSASRILKIPIVLHEQTLKAGITNKYLSKFADKVCISYETSRKYFPKEKVVLTGNPVRKSILSPIDNIGLSLEEPIIYITGGSVGSHQINKLVMETLPRLLEKSSVIHQTGGASKFSDFEKLQILKEGLNKGKKEKYLISKYFAPDEVGAIYKIASLVIGRSGINTVSELMAIEKPALLIPLHPSQKNEQLDNAAFFKKLGLGEVIDQKEIDPDFFLRVVHKMLKNLDKYRLKSKKAESSGAAKRIVKVIYETAQGRSN